MKERPMIRSPFEVKKAAYFSAFAARNIQQMYILKEGGVLGEGNEGWRNIAEHCLTEAVGGDILAEHLGANRELVIQGLLLHDWYKKEEILARKTMGALEAREKTSREDVEKLRSLGIPERVIEIAHANIPESNDPEYLASRPLEAKIIHYLDMVTDQSSFTEPEDRLRAVEAKPQVMEFLESFRERYNGKHLNEVQREVLAVEQQEFEGKLGLDPGTLIYFLNAELKKRIEKTDIKPSLALDGQYRYEP